MPDRFLKVLIPDGEVNGDLIFSVVKDDGTEYDPYYVKLSQISTFIGGGGGGLPYSVFTALMNQSATPTDPAVDILQNTFNAPIVWTRSEAGVFIGTLAGAFTYLVFMMAGLGQMPEGSTLKYGYSDDNTVFIETYDENGNTVDGLLNNVPIEIRVYP